MKEFKINNNNEEKRHLIEQKIKKEIDQRFESGYPTIFNQRKKFLCCSLRGV